MTETDDDPHIDATHYEQSPSTGYRETAAILHAVAGRREGSS